jgi:PadR family transcriptional regulator AphA
MSDIGTTACAILGLIAVKEGSAYELVQRMNSNYRFFWPRAQSHFYAEVKRLVELGLATASDEPSGKRPRTVYRITALGTKAIVAWLARPVEPPTLEFEGLLRIAYADFGTKAQLMRQLASIKENATQTLAVGAQIARDYADGRVELPQRSHVGHLLWQFLWTQHRARADWADWAMDEVRSWSNTRASTSNQKQSMDFFSKASKGIAAKQPAYSSPLKASATARTASR